MNTHFLPNETKRLLKPEDMGLVFCSAQRVEVDNSVIRLDSGKEELCLAVIDGCVSYSSAGGHGAANYLDMLYIPIDSSIVLSGGPGVVIRFGAPCSKKNRFAHLTFEQIDRDKDKHKVYGRKETGSERDVWNYITNDFPSGRLLTGICSGRKGGWTAWPPHKHGAKREEVYVYFGMGEGFAVQCLYDDIHKPDVYMVRDGHLVSIPHGYHPNCGCPFAEIKYVFCMVSVNEGERDFMDLTTQKVFGERLE